MEKESFVKDEIEFCEEKGFQKNEKGNFVYVSTDGIELINLPFILNDYKDWLIENKIVINLKK